MKKKLAKWAVTMLAGVMLALPATGNTVSASSEAKSQVQEETKTIENELNYIYIDEAELDVGLCKVLFFRGEKERRIFGV